MPLAGETGEMKRWRGRGRKRGFPGHEEGEWQRGEERKRPRDGLSFHLTVAGLLEGVNLSHLISRLGVFLDCVNLC